MNASAFAVDVEFVWGFQARIAGLSKTSPSFHYPPPTTFLGALGGSVARGLGMGESAGRRIITALGRDLLAFGLKPMNCIPIKYEDINKIIAVKMTSGILYPNPRNLSSSYDSPARGKTVMASLDENPPTVRFILVLKEEEIKFEDEAAIIDEDHFWKIHRLGSKESRVSVIDVKRYNYVNALEGRTSSEYSFPIINGVNPLGLQGRWLYESYINPREMSYAERDNPTSIYMEGRSLIPFRIPVLVTRIERPKLMVEVRYPAAFYEINGEGIVIGWRE